MKSTIPTLIIPIVCSLAVCIQARILMVVDSSFYAMDPRYASAVETYLDDIRTIDRKPADLILWKTAQGTTRDKCYPLWLRLRHEYQKRHHAPPSSDHIEGAIFVGSLPIPMFRHTSDVVWNSESNAADTVYHDGPHDYYFMDVWNSKTNSPYPSDTTLWRYHSRSGLFFNPIVGSQGNNYNWSNGDGKLDIWISRIMGEFVRIPVSGHHGIWYSDRELVYEYLVKAHERMTLPARVPPRSFSMSGITDWGSPDPDGVLCLDILNLPFHTAFGHPDNNPSNLQAQLQAGPRGNINFGAYYLRTPDSARIVRNPLYHWSTRNRIWESLFNKTSGTMVTDLDTLGYEWVGLYEHGTSTGIGMNGTHFAPSNGFTGLNGSFSSYSFSEAVANENPKGNLYLFGDPGGYKGSYVKFRNRDVCNSTIPGHLNIWEYGWNWTGQNGAWKFRPPLPGGYDVYLYYRALPDNNTSVFVRIDRMPRHDSGVVLTAGTVTIDQSVHTSEEFPGNNWEHLGRYTFDAHFFAGWTTYHSDTTRILIDANGNDREGYIILDAVKIVGVAGTPTAGRTMIVDNDSEGFSMAPHGNRTYLEMKADGGESKTLFFLANSCHLNDYPATVGCAYNSMGNLFAMLYNGLISMGTVNSNYAGRNYSEFITALKDGADFGQAFLTKANEDVGGDPEFILLGAGNLKATAYIPFGARMLADVTVNGTVNVQCAAPVYLRNYTVIPKGAVNLRTSKDIRVFPETRFPAGCNTRLSVR